jgi:hyperosmotically inducible periplasmic protein
MRTTITPLLAAALAAAGLAGCVTTPYGAATGQGVDDATITANVKAALVQDPVTRARNISVNTFEGTVELSGFVDNGAERHEALQVASGVPGVRSVQDQLRVNTEAPVAVGAAIDDRTLSEEVRSALAANPETATPRIKVSTAGGVVQLAGFVDSNEQRAAAGSIAGSVQGVRGVDNDLRLTPGD